MYLLIADKQDIAYAGLRHIAAELDGVECRRVADKQELVAALTEHPDAVVVLDYILFNLGDIDDLTVLGLRFPRAFLVLFSDDLTPAFVRIATERSQMISVVSKDAMLPEIRTALLYAREGKRFLCQRTMEMLLAERHAQEEKTPLTKTESEILRDVALGMTTKEIAAKRFSSFHTVNTHRKNIFRKIGVNNVHEATKYAMRAGLIDSSDYYI